MACDVIHLLSEYYKELCLFDQDLPLKIVEVCSLCFVLFFVRIPLFLLLFFNKSVAFYFFFLLSALKELSHSMLGYFGHVRNYF